MIWVPIVLKPKPKQDLSLRFALRPFENTTPSGQYMKPNLCEYIF